MTCVHGYRSSQFCAECFADGYAASLYTLLARCRSVLLKVEKGGTALTDACTGCAGCPVCGEPSFRAHAEDCELASLLKEIPK